MKIYLNGNHVRVILAVRNKSHKQAAQEAGITQEHFSRLIAQICCPGPETRKLIAKKVLPGVGWDKLFKIVEATSGSKL